MITKGSFEFNSELQSYLCVTKTKAKREKYGKVICRLRAVAVHESQEEIVACTDTRPAPSAQRTDCHNAGLGTRPVYLFTILNVGDPLSIKKFFVAPIRGLDHESIWVASPPKVTPPRHRCRGGVGSAAVREECGCNSCVHDRPDASSEAQLARWYNT